MANIVFDYNQLVRENGASDLTHPEISTIKAFAIHNERLNPNAKYLEIGICGGGTMKAVKDATKTTQLIGVDLFETFQMSGDNTHVSCVFRKDDVARFLGDRTTIICGNSDDVLPSLKDTYDFIFVDGNHTYDATTRDFHNATKLLAKGGKIALHNCSTNIAPDDYYVKRDGGPWLVMQDIMAAGEWRRVAFIDRLCVFSK